MEREKKPWRDIDRGKDRSVHRREAAETQRRRDETARANAEARQVRSALEALFTPKAAEPTPTPGEVARKDPRIVLPQNPNADPRNAERRRLLGKLLAAAGPGAITKVANEFLAAGFTLPDDQEIRMQLLEHLDEVRVRESVEALARILAGELPKRKHVLDQRLRRIEEHAEDGTTRDAASALRRLLHGRPSAPSRGSR